MELYLDSANSAEIKSAFELKFLTGLTTTPTFMHREGVKDTDKMIVELAKEVPILQIEALGKTAIEIVAEAERLLALGLDKTKTVFKIPVSLEGVKACDKLRSKDILVNVHLIYTLQQAYMATVAGANYVCPLVGRLQDQGQDALSIVGDAVEMVERYGYDTKIMFSSVRNVEHVRNAIQMGVHACTVPWKLLSILTDNYFTSIGTNEFFEHTYLVSSKVSDVVKSSPKIELSAEIVQGLIEMTKSKLGAVAVLDQGKLCGVFTDGDLRRRIEADGEKVMSQTFSQLKLNTPLTIDSEAALDEAWKIFKAKKIDTLVVLKDEKYFGMLDVQDLLAHIGASK